jgi:hypothetical protein
MQQFKDRADQGFTSLGKSMGRTIGSVESIDFSEAKMEILQREKRSVVARSLEEGKEKIEVSFHIHHELYMI